MNILIIEPDPSTGRKKQDSISECPYSTQVKIVSSPAGVLELLEREHYNLLILDIDPSHGNAWELIQKIRSGNICLEIIIVTSKRNHDTVKKALDLGVLDFIIAPYEPERFKDAINDAFIRYNAYLGSNELNQKSLDILFKKRTVFDDRKIAALPEKGMSPNTYKLVKQEIIRKDDAFTASQLSSQLGIARVTTRRYLDFMEKQGILEVLLSYGKIGRPQHRYRLKSKS